MNPANPLAQDPFAIMCMVILVMMLIGMPQLSKIAMSLKSEADIKKCMFIIIGLNFAALWIYWTGLYAKAALLDVPSMDYALPTYMIWLFPAGIAALFGVAILAAGMSTIDTQLTVVATSVTNDISLQWVRIRFSRVIVRSSFFNISIKEKVDPLLFMLYSCHL